MTNVYLRKKWSTSYIVIQRLEVHSQIHHEMQNFILVRLNTKRSHYLAVSGWASITSMMERCPHNRF